MKKRILSLALTLCLLAGVLRRPTGSMPRRMRAWNMRKTPT